MLGKIEDELYHCVINEEETCITGLRDNGEFYELIRYDLDVGIVQIENIDKKTDPITGGSRWNALLLYDGGNRILIAYDDENGDEQWLFYDFSTEEYNIVEGRKNKTYTFLAINDKEVWYAPFYGSVYRYNIKTGKSVNILDHVNSPVVAADTGLVAYIEDSMHPKKIYRYNVNRNTIKCIAKKGWNISYGTLADNRGQWSKDGSCFFYVKYFPLLFDGANTSLMVYNTKNDRSFCIYKEWNTGNEFKYIGNSG